MHAEELVWLKAASYADLLENLRIMKKLTLPRHSFSPPFAVPVEIEKSKSILAPKPTHVEALLCSVNKVVDLAYESRTSGAQYD
jgi:hypothetical protein